MAKKISELPQASAYEGGESILMVQDTRTRQGSLSSFVNYLSGELLTDSELAALSGSWENTYTTVSANSASWSEQADLTELQAASGSWDYTTTFVQDNSATWESDLNVVSEFQSSSGVWQSTYTTVSANSASWIFNLYDTIEVTGSLSPDATGIYTAAGTFGGKPYYERSDGSFYIWWNITDWFISSGVNATNTNDTWKSATAGSILEFNPLGIGGSSATGTAYTNGIITGNSNAASWDSTYTTVSANSAQWAIDTVYDDTPVTELQAASGNWDSTYTTVSLTSSNWNSAYNTIATEKSGWINTNNSLDSVTDNGNTTTNDITVGRISTTANTINGLGTLAIGGLSLSATGNYAAAIGGLNSLTSGKRACIIGGSNNEASGDDSEVLGGQSSKATATFATVVGGGSLSATNTAALAAGGFNNLANGDYNAIIGGSGSVNNSNYSAIVGATNAVMSSGHNRSVILGGVGLSSFAANTVYVPSLDVNAGFKMPTGASAGYVLTTDANGVGTWQAAAGGGGGGNPGTTTGVSTTYHIQAANIDTSAFGTGNARGSLSVDLQQEFAIASAVASGNASVVAGGLGNTASANNSTVAGGYQNSATNTYAAVGGGTGNTASGTYSVIAGGKGNSAIGKDNAAIAGRNNTISGDYFGIIGAHAIGGGESNTINSGNGFCVIAGGKNNTVSSNYGFGNSILGGSNNTVSSYSAYATIAGGSNNTASGSQSFIGGGGSNSASGQHSVVAGGSGNTASGNGATVVGGQLNKATGNNSLVGGQYAKTTVNNTIELGHWTNSSTRGSSIRVHPNKQVAHSIVDSATAPTDGGATAGSEADGTLARDMFTIQKNGTAVTLYFNNAGTIQSLSLGTLA